MEKYQEFVYENILFEIYDLPKPTIEELDFCIEDRSKVFEKSKITKIILKPDENSDDTLISASVDPISFDRIRRITGYLVGTLDRFNSGKKAEEADRVKHNLSK